MGYAKYLEDIVDRLVEDLSADVPAEHLRQSIEGLDWPKVSARTDAQERLSETDHAKDVLRRFLTHVIHKMRDQGQEIRLLKSELRSQRQHYALASQRHAEVRDKKDNVIKSLQTKIMNIMTVRNRRH